MDAGLRERMHRLRSGIGQTGVFLDFDGTLAPIVLDPSTSKTLPGVSNALTALAQKAALVAIVSGRPAAFLAERLPMSAGLHIHGLYGLQTFVDGEVRENPDAARWREVVDAGATTAESELPRGMHVERKGASFVLHYRVQPNLESTAEQWAAGFAERSGLDAQKGRLSIEIGPFSTTDKGKTVADLARGLRNACVIGDDSGDLPMFQAAKRVLGDSAVNVLVASSETPARLRSAADHEVKGPAEVLELIELLAD